MDFLFEGPYGFTVRTWCVLLYAAFCVWWYFSFRIARQIACRQRRLTISIYVVLFSGPIGLVCLNCLFVWVAIQQRFWIAVLSHAIVVVSVAGLVVVFINHELRDFVSNALKEEESRRKTEQHNAERLETDSWWEALDRAEKQARTAEAEAYNTAIWRSLSEEHRHFEAVLWAKRELGEERRREKQERLERQEWLDHQQITNSVERKVQNPIALTIPKRSEPSRVMPVHHDDDEDEEGYEYDDAPTRQSGLTSEQWSRVVKDTVVAGSTLGLLVLALAFLWWLLSGSNSEVVVWFNRVFLVLAVILGIAALVAPFAFYREQYKKQGTLATAEDERLRQLRQPLAEQIRVFATRQQRYADLLNYPDEKWKRWAESERYDEVATEWQKEMEEYEGMRSKVGPAGYSAARKLAFRKAAGTMRWEAIWKRRMEIHNWARFDSKRKDRALEELTFKWDHSRADKLEEIKTQKLADALRGPPPPSPFDDEDL